MFNNFMLRATALSVFTVSIFNAWLHEQKTRQPASQDKQIELHIKQMFIDDAAAAKRIEGKYFIKATFADNFEFEFGKNDNLVINRSGATPLDYKIDVNDAWLKNGQLSFKIEVISKETFSKTLVVCQQVADAVKDLNRSYQCFLPLQRQSFLTYRLGDKNVTPDMPSKLASVK